MRSRKITTTFVIIIFILSLNPLYSQTKHYYGSYWTRLYLGDKIAKNVSWQIYLQHQRVADPGTDELRTKEQYRGHWLWLHFKLKKNLRLTLTPISYFEIRPIFNMNSRAIKEYRWAARIDHLIEFNRFSILNWFAFEYRYRDLITQNEFIGNFRARYLFELRVPLAKINKQPLSLIGHNEIFIQFGEAVKNSPGIFDQNRIFGGLSYNLSTNTRLVVGYNNMQLLRPSGKDLDIQNSFCVYLFLNNLCSQFAPKAKKKE